MRIKRYTNAHLPYKKEMVANSLMDDEKFHTKRFLNHLKIGNIKLMFYDMQTFKKVEKINITRPFIIYAMKKCELKTNKGKDSYRYSRPLSWKIAEISGIGSSYALWNTDLIELARGIAANNNMSTELEFILDFKESYQASYRNIKEAWQRRHIPKWRSGKNVKKIHRHLITEENFPLNHNFLSLVSIAKDQFITTDMLKEDMLKNFNPNPSSTVVSELDTYAAKYNKNKMRQQILDEISVDPALIHTVHNDDLNDRDFVTRLTYIGNPYFYNNGFYHKYINLLNIPQAFRDDEDIALSFLLFNTDNAKYLSDRLRCSRDFILKNKLSQMVEHFSMELRNDFDFMKSLHATRYDEHYHSTSLSLSFWRNVGGNLRSRREFSLFLLDALRAYSNDYEDDSYNEEIFSLLDQDVIDYCNKYEPAFTRKNIENYYELKEMGEKIVEKEVEVVRPKRTKI